MDGKVLSLHGRLMLADPSGRPAGQVHRKLVAFRPTYEITMDGKNVAEIRKRPFTLFGERFIIDVRGAGGIEINGECLDQFGREILRVSADRIRCADVVLMRAR